jgi:hypothetical protein
MRFTPKLKIDTAIVSKPEKVTDSLCILFTHKYTFFSSRIKMYMFKT